MASPGRNIHNTSYVSSAAIKTLRCPFPGVRSVKFWGPGGVWGIKFVGEEGMDADNYLSNTNPDTGVTVAADGTVTVAVGADVNPGAGRVFVEMSE
jgi:hypothetical protein